MEAIFGRDLKDLLGQNQKTSGRAEKIPDTTKIFIVIFKVFNFCSVPLHFQKVCDNFYFPFIFFWNNFILKSFLDILRSYLSFTFPSNIPEILSVNSDHVA